MGPRTAPMLPHHVLHGRWRQTERGFLGLSQGHPAKLGYGRGGTNDTACCRGEAAGTPVDRGLLWSSGIIDSGEDSSTRFCKVTNHTVPYSPCATSYAFPIQSADVTSYSFDCKASLARLALMRGDQTAAKAWADKAASLAANLKAQLWVEAVSPAEFCPNQPTCKHGQDWHLMPCFACSLQEGAMFARDAADERITTLVHDSLRVMWMGAFDQKMADAFVARHLMNESEFWTKAPLPSIAVSDPRYNNLTNANSWAGRPMGLTYQRAIRALERYGHHAEVTMIGQLLSDAILAFDGCAGDSAQIANATSRLTSCHFTLEIDPFTANPRWAPWSPSDGYGPMLMAFLEYTALRVGVVPRPPDASMGPLRSGAAATLFWSGVQNVTAHVTAPGAASTYSQTLGGSTYTLVLDGKGQMHGSKDGKRLFSCSDGVRVVSTLGGTVTGLVGIDSTAKTVALTVPAGGGGAGLKQVVKPNEEWSVHTAVVAAGLGGSGDRLAMAAKLSRAAPFVLPFKSDDMQKKRGFPGGSVDQKLVVLTTADADKFGAKCLDGSPPAIYYSPARGAENQDNLVLYFKGGGWCWDEEGCAGRSSTTLGTTSALPELMKDTWDKSSGPMHSNITLNPTFANCVVLWYCDG